MTQRPLAVATGAFVAFAAAACIPAYSTGATLGSSAGAWLALAIDLTHGVFYRPLLDTAGIGGTRYFPLIFVVHAGLIRLGVPAVAAGRAIAIAAALALVWAAHRVLEETGTPRTTARLLAPLTLCSSPGLFALTTIRGDLVPAALNLWGVVFVLQAMRRDRRVDMAGAVLMFALAAFAKITAFYALAACTAALALNRRGRKALILSIGSVAATAALLTVANAASGGRMLEILRVCLWGGGDRAAALHAPLAAMYVLVRQDPLCTVLLVFAGVAAANMTRDGWREPLTVLMVAALGLAVVINASPGADVNHLLDFYVVALLFVASQMTRGRLQPNLAAWSIAVAASLTMVAAYLDLRHDMLSGERAQVPAVRALVRDFREPGKPIFSADAMLPSLEGERSYMLDNWMYQFLRRTDPRYDSAITSRIASGDFGVVVLQTDPADARTAELYGQGFVRALNGRYEVAGRLPPYVVLRPKHGAEQRRASEGAGAVRSHVE